MEGVVLEVPCGQRVHPLRLDRGRLVPVVDHAGDAETILGALAGERVHCLELARAWDDLERAVEVACGLLFDGGEPTARRTHLRLVLGLQSASFGRHVPSVAGDAPTTELLLAAWALPPEGRRRLVGAALDRLAAAWPTGGAAPAAAELVRRRLRRLVRDHLGDAGLFAGSTSPVVDLAPGGEVRWDDRRLTVPVAEVAAFADKLLGARAAAAERTAGGPGS